MGLSVVELCWLPGKLISVDVPGQKKLVETFCFVFEHINGWNLKYCVLLGPLKDLCAAPVHLCLDE